MDTANTPQIPKASGERERRPLWQRITPAIGLFFLAPLVGEYLLGNISVSGLWALPFLAPMYGGGALLIREIARRTGRGWPTVILLAMAYGLLQAGLLDQSLFNPSFGNHDFWQDQRLPTYIPALGVSVEQTLIFIVGHTVWSISVPIALVEALVPAQRTTAWLGKVGLTLISILFVLGCLFVFSDHQETEQFLASVPQLVGATIVIVTLIVTAFTISRWPRTTIHRQAPNPFLIGTAVLIASSLYHMFRPNNWLGVALGILLIAVMTLLITRWSRYEGWSATHHVAVAGGALLTYAWAGLPVALALGYTSTIDLIGNAVFAACAILLLLIAWRQAHNISPGEKKM